MGCGGTLSLGGHSVRADGLDCCFLLFFPRSLSASLSSPPTQLPALMAHTTFPAGGLVADSRIQGFPVLQ